MKCTEIKCFLCPDIDGMMKKVAPGMWAHIACVNWIPEIWFTDDSRSKVAGELPKKRLDINCGRCRKK